MADLSELIAAHKAAMATWDKTNDEAWGTSAGREAGERIDAAQKAIFEHRPASLSEVREKAAYMASCRTFTEWENFDQVKLIEALTPEAPATVDPAMLPTLIKKLEETRAEYRRQYEIDSDSRETDGAYDAMAASEFAVIAHPCSSLAEVRRKAALALADDMVMDSLTNCTIRGEPVMSTFLRSLLGETEVADAGLSGLILAHKTAWAALETAIDAADHAMGTDEQVAADETKNKASDATADAIWSIVEYPYSSLDELRLGMGYLVIHHRSTGDGDLDEWLTALACKVAGIEDETGGASCD